MLIAPHPDDESLACGILLQRAVRAGAAVRVLYATDGDNNPWPQRALERKWRLGSRDRERWGRLRRIEARAALRALGVERASAQFLGLPDQGLTDLLMQGCPSVFESIAEAITAWKPTLLLVPSMSDTHADHNALGVVLRLISEDLLAQTRDRAIWSYIVHGRSAAFTRSAETLAQSHSETVTKLSAIRCHKTQVALSRRRFLRYATRPEKFRKLHPREAAGSGGPLRSSMRDSVHLRLKIRLPFRPFPAAHSRLILLGRDTSNSLKCMTLRLPARSGNFALVDHGTGRRSVMMSYRGNAFAGEATIPTSLFSSTSPLFVKIDRGGVLSKDHWIEVNALNVERPRAVQRRDRDVVASLP